MPPSWSFRVTPYGWLTALDGTQTVRGRSVKVDASFIDIVRESDTLVALMGDFEARNGPLGLLANVAWSKIGFERGDVRSRALASGVTGTLGTSLGLDIEMVIAEVGAAYEVARVGALAVDVLAGARYWYQRPIFRSTSRPRSTSATCRLPGRGPSPAPARSIGSIP